MGGSVADCSVSCPHPFASSPLGFSAARGGERLKLPPGWEQPEVRSCRRDRRGRMAGERTSRGMEALGPGKDRTFDGADLHEQGQGRGPGSLSFESGLPGWGEDERVPAAAARGGGVEEEGGDEEGGATRLEAGALLLEAGARVLVAAAVSAVEVEVVIIEAAVLVWLGAAAEEGEASVEEEGSSSQRE